MSNPRALSAVLTSALLVLGARDASAFCRTTTCDPNDASDQCERNEDGCVRDGVPIKWKELPIVYRFHAAGSTKLETSGAREAIRRAFEAWENIECTRGRTSLRFREGSEIEEDKPLDTKDAVEKFGIYFRDDEWPHDGAEESLALTTQIYGKTSGTIDYADIEINTAGVEFRLGDDEGADKVDLQAVVTHEVGHYIGLAHSNDPDSIMVARYCASADRCGQSTELARGLSDDDTRAVCALYPPAARSAADPTPSGCTQGRATSPGSAVAIGGLAFLGCALVRRRASIR